MPAANKQLIMDLEVYGDYFLAAFLNTSTGAVRHFEKFDGQVLDVDTIRRILRTYEIVTFNGAGFDLPVLAIALAGATNARIKEVCDAIILRNLKPWIVEREFGIKVPTVDHIDLIEVAPSVASLKMYGARLGLRNLQDLPIEPGASIAPADRAALRTYCENDLHTTAALYRALEQQIGLRRSMSEEYGEDLRSKSDAQIAETVIRSKVTSLIGREIERPAVTDEPFKYTAPAYITFDTPALQSVLAEILAAEFYCRSTGGVVEPEALARTVAIGAGQYRMGMGGLHSTESRTTHRADADHILVDRDVASYYPTIILNCGLYPEQMGAAFLTTYRDIVDRRLAAKRNGNKVMADALKITINGSFGKFGSQYSRLFSPNLLVQTTVTGQLALLMLIEWLELAHIPVVSANTDGIVIKCPRHLVGAMDDIVFGWECVTGFDTEATDYLALHSRDVNSYIAMKADGYKVKGAYAPAGLAKNPDAQVSIDAAIAYLRHGTPVEDTIDACKDVRNFLRARTVRGGALWRDQYLGRVVRWYYALAGDVITYKINGRKVPDTDGAQPMQTLLDTWPADIDYGRYINDAKQIIEEVGA